MSSSGPVADWPCYIPVVFFVRLVFNKNIVNLAKLHWQFKFKDSDYFKVGLMVKIR